MHGSFNNTKKGQSCQSIGMVCCQSTFLLQARGCHNGKVAGSPQELASTTRLTTCSCVLLQVHSTGKAASNWGGFRQRYLQTVEAVVRAAGAEFPVPTSVLYSVAAPGPPSTAGADSGSSILLLPRSAAEGDSSSAAPSTTSSTDGTSPNGDATEPVQS